MKRFFTIILTVLIIALVVFGVHSCKKSTFSPSNTGNPTDGIIGTTPEQDGDKSSSGNKDIKDKLENADDEESLEIREEHFEESLKTAETYTGTGVFHGKADSTSVEITLDSVQPMLISAKLSPEIAEKFASYDITEESIISFEYKIVDEQYVITKILK
ncbi:MAG: hypothetical protein IKW02_03180 [Clostridia bacterium]|nr:hypothetical protein [Clostridia bacterium]